MQAYQIEKYFYTRTKNIVPTESGKELFLFASLIMEINQPLGNSNRNKVIPVVSKLYEKSVAACPPIYLELANDTIMEEISYETFEKLKVMAEKDEYSFFLFKTK